jgi:hypothetical protein
MAATDLAILVHGAEELNEASRNHLIRKLKQTINVHIDNDNPAGSDLSLDPEVLEQPHYASLKGKCPHCEVPLRFHSPDLDPANGATATAACPECTFSATGQYRLIDLLVPQSDGRREGTVQAGQQQPDYYEYGKPISVSPEEADERD